MYLIPESQLENVPPAHPIKHQGAKTYNTAGGFRLLTLTPKLISPSLDIIHPIHNDYTISAQQPLHPPIYDCAGLFLGPSRIINGARVSSIVRSDDVDLISCFGFGCKVCLELVEERGELPGAVAETGARVAGQDY